MYLYFTVLPTNPLSHFSLAPELHPLTPPGFSEHGLNASTLDSTPSLLHLLSKIPSKQLTSLSLYLGLSPKFRNLSNCLLLIFTWIYHQHLKIHYRFLNSLLEFVSPRFLWVILDVERTFSLNSSYPTQLAVNLINILFHMFLKSILSFPDPYLQFILGNNHSFINLKYLQHTFCLAARMCLR